MSASAFCTWLTQDSYESSLIDRIGNHTFVTNVSRYREVAQVVTDGFEAALEQRPGSKALRYDTVYILCFPLFPFPSYITLASGLNVL